MAVTQDIEGEEPISEKSRKNLLFFLFFSCIATILAVYLKRSGKKVEDLWRNVVDLPT